jgi:hypothetical protein
MRRRSQLDRSGHDRGEIVYAMKFGLVEEESEKGY